MRGGRFDKKAFKEKVRDSVKMLYRKDFEDASQQELYQAVSNCKRFEQRSTKIVYYLSMEFLVGRALGNNLLNLGEYEGVKDALKELGLDLNALEDQEPDPALGNGGLGRLAACFMESLATGGYHAYGCGIRYHYGMFKQKIKNGFQEEVPDNWLKHGYPFELKRPEHSHEVRFGGLRIWDAEAIVDFELSSFDKGHYDKAVEQQNLARTITEVLYPNDNHYAGKELRLKQQYFFVSASLQEALEKHMRQYGTLENLPEKASFQMNDTHPTVSVPELMRLLMDEYHMEWDDAWDMTTKCCAYTNHTIMAEALEKWPIDLFSRLLPRIYQIIEEINRRFENEVPLKMKCARNIRTAGVKSSKIWASSMTVRSAWRILQSSAAIRSTALQRFTRRSLRRTF